MWLILRLKGLGKCLREAQAFAHHEYPLLLGGKITGWGRCSMVYLGYRGIFYNLVMSRVIINTLLYNPISEIVKVLAAVPVDIGTLPNHVKSVFPSLFFSLILSP